MICFNKKECKHPKWIEWCNKEPQEQEKIAEKNEWLWYFDWFDIGEILRTDYEKADKDPKVANKYGGYDKWYEEHKTEYSYVYLGADAKFHETEKPIRQWTVYNPCTNKNCPYNQGKYADNDNCGFFGCNERQYDCFNDLFASIQAFIDVCGIENLDEFAKHFDIHKDIIGWFKFGNKYFKKNNQYNILKMNIMKEYNLSESEAELYIDENFTEKDIIDTIGEIPMISDLYELIKKLEISDKQEEKPSVFWTDGMTYINDYYENQFAFESDLFTAWKFAHIFELSFDYDANDSNVCNLGNAIVDAYYDETNINKDININQYFNDIKKDFNELLLVDWNNIDWQQIKRHIVQCIEEEPFACSYGGSATFIAKWLWETINEHIGDTNEYGHRKVIYADDDKNNIKDAIIHSTKNAPKFRDNHPNKNILRKLRDEYLQANEYDIIEFAKALKKVNKYRMTVPKTFDEYLLQANKISRKCYYLLGYLLRNNINNKEKILVGYIDWFDDYEKNKRYIYCHIDSNKNEIYFKENRKAPKSAYLHDIAFPHLISDPNRLQKDIEIKFTEKYIDEIVKNKIGKYEGEEWGYIHCHMYGNIGKYTG